MSALPKSFITLMAAEPALPRSFIAGLSIERIEMLHDEARDDEIRDAGFVAEDATDDDES